MKYKREEIVSNLYETSKSSTGKAMLSVSADKYEVYHLDLIKEKFCKYYRHSDKIKSCDAYYYDSHNHIIMEFKNAHHMKLKDYYDEIEIKLLDTHMLCRENFWKNKKLNAILNNVKVVVVYNDTLNNGEGVNRIADSLNKMRPLQGDSCRHTKALSQFSSEEEFQDKVNNTKEKYEKEFYQEIEFIDKKEFEKRYVDTGYFLELENWAEVE